MSLVLDCGKMRGQIFGLSIVQFGLLVIAIVTAITIFIFYIGNGEEAGFFEKLTNFITSLFD